MFVAPKVTFPAPLLVNPQPFPLMTPFRFRFPPLAELSVTLLESASVPASVSFPEVARLLMNFAPVEPLRTVIAYVRFCPPPAAPSASVAVWLPVTSPKK